MPAARPSKSVIANMIAEFRAAYGDIPARMMATKDGDFVIEPVAKAPEPAKKERARQWGTV